MLIMKTNKFLILLVGTLFVLASCSQDEYFLFNDEARIQFGPEMSKIYSATSNQADTTKNYTFFYLEKDKTQDTVFFDIYAIGGPSTKDRSFSLKQVQLNDGSTNAVAGVDYKAFTDPTFSSTYVIKAGQVHAFVPIVLLRSSALKSTTATLKFSVAENENFKLGETNNLWRKVVFTDRLSQPNSWTSYYSQYYFGAYSVVKHAFMIQVTGEKWDQAFMTILLAPGSDMALLTYYISAFKHALTDYNAAHPGNPMVDENGQLIVFP